jgi:hypothetical protein
VDVPWIADYGFELSRAFPALRPDDDQELAYAIRAHRSEEHDQAHLAGRIEAAPELFGAPVSLNVACFRYCRAG